MKRLAVLLIALAAGGCGFGSGGSNGQVTVTVSRNFGASSLAPEKHQTAKADETVMRLLQSDFDVKTRYGGGFVQEIDGLSGGEQNGRKVDWFYYVNGVEASKGAAATKLSPGDEVWWDHHEWTAAQRIPAVVGAFPEPFLDGIGGKKLPVRLVCMGDVGRSCNEVEKRLQQEDVNAVARSNLEQSVGEVLRIIVGPWRQVREDITARQLEAGPGTSGVFAKPDAAGDKIALLDSQGNVAMTLGPGSGLIAATSYTDQQPTWLVTGTDDVGVAAAAAGLTEDVLHDHFAVAITGGKGVPLPVVEP
jgi:Domain of unknown function (DUF4430)